MLFKSWQCCLTISCISMHKTWHMADTRHSSLCMWDVPQMKGPNSFQFLKRIMMREITCAMPAAHEYVAYNSPVNSWCILFKRYENIELFNCPWSLVDVSPQTPPFPHACHSASKGANHISAIVWKCNVHDRRRKLLPLGARFVNSIMIHEIKCAMPSAHELKHFVTFWPPPRGLVHRLMSHGRHMYDRRPRMVDEIS